MTDACIAPDAAWDQHRVRVFCLPFAGGSALSYAAFAFHLPPELAACPIRLPGRDGRPPAPPQSLEALADQLADGILPFTDRPFAIFGHSLGAQLGFEVAHRLERAGRPPGILYASASHAPGTDAGQVADPAAMSDAELLDALVAASALDSDIAASPLILQEVLPLFRWDLAFAARYRGPAAPLAQCPIVALGGTQDPSVDSRGLLAWRAMTRGAFRVRRFPGDHFYAFRRTSELIGHLRPELERLAQLAPDHQTGAAR